jgi:hypothetical protein
LLVPDFVLGEESAEVMLEVGGKSYGVPILVTDLVALPAAPGGVDLGIEELLLLLSRRIGAERAIEIAKKRKSPQPPEESGSTYENSLALFFGEGFGPTDVFRAWWAVADDLSGESLSVPSFRLRLEGPMSVERAWRCILNASREGSELSPAEAWFYGAELLRTMDEEVRLKGTTDALDKAKLLALFKARVRTELAKIRFAGDDRPWVSKVRSFYGALES